MLLGYETKIVLGIGLAVAAIVLVGLRSVLDLFTGSGGKHLEPRDRHFLIITIVGVAIFSIALHALSNLGKKSGLTDLFFPTLLTLVIIALVFRKSEESKKPIKIVRIVTKLLLVVFVLLLIFGPRYDAQFVPPDFFKSHATVLVNLICAPIVGVFGGFVALSVYFLWRLLRSYLGDMSVQNGIILPPVLAVFTKPFLACCSAMTFEVLVLLFFSYFEHVWRLVGSS